MFLSSNRSLFWPRGSRTRQISLPYDPLLRDQNAILLPISINEHDSFFPPYTTKRRAYTFDLWEYIENETDEHNKRKRKCTVFYQTFRETTATRSLKTHFQENGLLRDSKNYQRRLDRSCEVAPTFLDTSREKLKLFKVYLCKRA